MVLYIRIELWPFGNEDMKQVLAEGHIGRIAMSDDKTSGDYSVRLLVREKDNEKRKLWKRGVVKGFPRLKRNAWDLLCVALRGTIGKRNQEGATDESVQHRVREESTRGVHSGDAESDHG